MVLAIDCCCCLFIVCGHLNNARSLMNSPRSGHTIASFEFDLLSNSERGPINCKTMRFILISRPQRVDKENNRNLEQNFLHFEVCKKEIYILMLYNPKKNVNCIHKLFSM